MCKGNVWLFTVQVAIMQQEFSQIPQTGAPFSAKCFRWREKPDRKQHTALWQLTLHELICTNSTQLTHRQRGWLHARPRPGCNLASAQWNDCFPTSQHSMGSCTGTHESHQFVLSTSSHTCTRYGISLTFQGLKAAPSPLPGFLFPSSSFTTTSSHADHSSEVVTVGGGPGGVCLFVLSVWMCVWLRGRGSVCAYVWRRMGENTRCFKREKKGFVYGQRATHTISVISVGDTASQRSRRAAEARRRGERERDCCTGHLQSGSNKAHQHHLNTDSHASQPADLVH